MEKNGATGEDNLKKMSAETKICPYCAERIKAKAIKCKHCKSMLEDNKSDFQNASKDQSYKSYLSNYGAAKELLEFRKLLINCLEEAYVATLVKINKGELLFIGELMLWGATDYIGQARKEDTAHAMLIHLELVLEEDFFVPNDLAFMDNIEDLQKKYWASTIISSGGIAFGLMFDKEWNFSGDKDICMQIVSEILTSKDVMSQLRESGIRGSAYYQ